jgi:hypothetical protein
MFLFVQNAMINKLNGQTTKLKNQVKIGKKALEDEKLKYARGLI